MNNKTIVAVALTLMCAGVVPAARAQSTYTENFTGTTTTNSWYFLNGACLTMGTAAASTAANPACAGLAYYINKGDPNLIGGNTGTLPDTGSGALRFTNKFNENGAILSNFNFPLSTQGLAVSFTTVTYDGNSGGTGGDGADGISFFLQDATYPADVGAFGGSLGYTCSNANNDGTLRSNGNQRGYDGLAGGYIGLGIDEYGNFLNPGDNTATGPGYQWNRIGMRGPGNISWSSLNAAYPTQYPNTLSISQKASAVQYACSTGRFQNWSNPASVVAFVPATPLLDYAYINGASKVLLATQKIANEAATGGTTRGAAIPITYNLKILPSGTTTNPTALLSLAYSYNGGALQNVITNQDITAGGTIPVPDNVRFGFAGSTGGASNVHEIMCFQATPTNVSQSSAGLNQKQTAKVQVGTQVYFAFYNPSTLAGSLTSQYLDQDPNNANNLSIDPTINWDGSCNLTGAAAGACDTPNGPTGAIAAQAWDTGRTILSWNDSTRAGIPFQWASLSANQQAKLNSGDGVVTVPATVYPNNNQSRLKYLRGQRSEEQTPTSSTTFTGALRARTSVLGDIIDSSPTWVGPPTAPYPDAWVDSLYATGVTIPENLGQTYSIYAGSGTTGYQTRTNVVYAGANDGMLHAFRSGSYNSANVYQTTNNDGREVLAYVPGYIVNTIQSATNVAANYSDPQYGHHFDVDAPPGTGDLFYSGTWHTWLVGGLGQGGNAIYALDITNPDNTALNNSFSEGNASRIVIGEWNYSTSTTVSGGVTTTTNTSTLTCTNVATGCAVNLGKTYGVPQIRRFHNGLWGAVFGNGYRSATGDAGIFIMLVDTSGNVTFRYLSTGTGTLASPSTDGIYYTTPADLDADHIVDYVYAGDLLGNIWRFDLTDKNDANWAVVTNPVYKTSSSQPITTKVIVASVAGNPNPHVLIEFGTGQQTPITNSAAAGYATAQQALYGVWDWNMSTWNGISSSQYASKSSASQQQGTSNLVHQSIQITTAATSAGTGTDYRTVSSLPVCYADTSGCTSYGWYLNLKYGNAYSPDPAVPQTGNAQYAGNPVVYEQVIFNPVLQSGAFIVNTTIPPANSPTMCFSSGAAGWTMALNPATGGAFTNSFFGDSNHNFLNTLDSNGGTVPVSGLALSGTGSASIVVSGTQNYLITQTVSGVGAIEAVNPPGGTKGSRLTWIERR